MIAVNFMFWGCMNRHSRRVDGLEGLSRVVFSLRGCRLQAAYLDGSMATDVCSRAAGRGQADRTDAEGNELKVLSIFSDPSIHRSLVWVHKVDASDKLDRVARDRPWPSIFAKKNRERQQE